jgi:hypothetical protein
MRGHTFAEISSEERDSKIELWPDSADREWFNAMVERVRSRSA